LAASTKRRDSPTAIVPFGKNFKAKFNELDNWLGIMDIDPPHDEEEKRAMYVRLIDILDNLFDAETAGKNYARPRKIKEKARPARWSKQQIQQQMRKIIDP
jgi:hypothetical protein